MECRFIVKGLEIKFNDIEDFYDYLSEETGLYVCELKDLKVESLFRLLNKALKLKNKELHRTEPDMEDIRKLIGYRDKREGQVENDSKLILYDLNNTDLYANDEGIICITKRGYSQNRKDLESKGFTYQNYRYR